MNIHFIGLMLFLNYFATSKIIEVQLERSHSNDELFERNFFFKIFSKFRNLESFVKENSHKNKFFSKYKVKLQNYYLSYKRLYGQLSQKYPQEVVTESMGNYWEIYFYGNVSVGTPPQQLLLQFDTGSTDLWVPLPGCVGCNDTFTFNPSLSESYKGTNQIFNISYGNGDTYSSGKNAYETVQLAGLKLEDFQIAVISLAVGNIPTPASGLLGLSYQSNSAAIPQQKNIVKELVKQNQLESAIFSIYLSPHRNEKGSKLILGGVNSEYYSGEIKYHKIFANFSEFNIRYQGFEVNGELIIDSNNFTVVDSGTALIQTPQNVITSLLNWVGEIDPDCQGIDNSRYPDIYVVIEEEKYLLKPEQYIFNSHVHQKCIFGFLSASVGNSILGDLFQKVYYCVFDLENNKLGIATSQ